MKNALLYLLFLLLTFATCTRPAQQSVSKTTTLPPTVLMISLDGFRPDYLDAARTPNLMQIANEGVRAKWLIPSFPSKTFPNHYAIATGLYPEHNGIVDNRFYDPEFNAEFALGKLPDQNNPRWWLGEPIWTTAEKQGQKAGCFFWVGSEVPINGVLPTYWKPFDDKVADEARVDSVLSWLDKPAAQRPTLLTLYFSKVDHVGHAAGPDSPEVRQAAQDVDASIGRLLAGLTQRGIANQVNIIVTSDHGMAAMSTERVVYLDDRINLDMMERTLWGELTQLWPKPGKTDSVYQALKTNPLPHLTVYKKGELPARFHYADSRRIAPILCMAEDGWTLTSHPYFGRMRDRLSKGAHGFDNQLPSMRALFVARGPALKRGYVAEPFENVHIYPLVAEILKLKPAKTDGTLDSVRVLLK